MTSRSSLTYAERATQHVHAVAKLFLETAERKQSNVVVSADLTTSHELLECANRQRYAPSRMDAMLTATSARPVYFSVQDAHRHCA